MAEGKNLQQEPKKKKILLKYTILTSYPQNSWQIIVASHTKSGPKYFQDLVLKDLVVSNKSNLLCFSSTEVGIYTCMEREPDLPPGDCHETPWDCCHSLLPLPFNHRAAFVSEGRDQCWNFLSAIKCLGHLLPNSCWLHMWQDQTSLFRKLPTQRAIS